MTTHGDASARCRDDKDAHTDDKQTAAPRRRRAAT